MNVVGYKGRFKRKNSHRRHRFYMNVVGYKERIPALIQLAVNLFYMNVVGYKVVRRKRNDNAVIYVLYERSGI